MKQNIHFFTESLHFTLSQKTPLRKWINLVARDEHRRTGEINFIFCSDEYLSEINVKYLQHNTLTDIITFSFSEEEEIISGDIYISIPRVTENAEKFGVGFYEELHRVMVHGILHLTGHDDGTTSDKRKMRELEDRYLEKRTGIIFV